MSFFSRAENEEVTEDFKQMFMRIAQPDFLPLKPKVSFREYRNKLRAVILTCDGKAFGYGYNASGKLGFPRSRKEVSTSARIEFPNGAKICDVFCDSRKTYYLCNNGDLYVSGHISSKFRREKGVRRVKFKRGDCGDLNVHTVFWCTERPVKIRSGVASIKDGEIRVPDFATYKIMCEYRGEQYLSHELDKFGLRFTNGDIVRENEICCNQTGLEEMREVLQELSPPEVKFKHIYKAEGGKSNKRFCLAEDNSVYILERNCEMYRWQLTEIFKDVEPNPEECNKIKKYADVVFKLQS